MGTLPLLPAAAVPDAAPTAPTDATSMLFPCCPPSGGGGICTGAGGGGAGIGGAVYKFFNRFVSSDLESLRPASGGLGGDDEEGPAAVTMEGTAACVAAPASLFLVSASLSSDPEESPPMSKSSMRPMLLFEQEKKVVIEKKVKKFQGKQQEGSLCAEKGQNLVPCNYSCDDNPPSPIMTAHATNTNRTVDSHLTSYQRDAEDAATAQR